MLEGYVSAEFCAKVTKNKGWKVGEGAHEPDLLLRFSYPYSYSIGLVRRVILYL